MKTGKRGSGMTQEQYESPLRSALMLPLERLLDSPVYAKLAAVIVALSSAVRADILFLLLWALFFASLWDTVLGRAAAKRRGQDVTVDRTRTGFLTKVTGFVLVGLVRMIEIWGLEHRITGLELTQGSFSAAFALTLLVMEIESIESNRISLGAKPIPLLSSFVRMMRAVESRLLAAFGDPPAPKPDTKP